MITETIEWVPVEERLPEEGQDVFVAKSGDASAPISRAVWDEDCQLWHDGWHGIDHAVTHWAEIKGPGK